MRDKLYSAMVFVLSTGSNVLVVIVSSAIAYYSIKDDGESPLRLTGIYIHTHIYICYRIHVERFLEKPSFP